MHVQIAKNKFLCGDPRRGELPFPIDTLANELTLKWLDMPLFCRFQTTCREQIDDQHNML